MMSKILTDNADSFTSVTPLEAVYGLGGNDTLTASSGGNLLAGGLGADKLYGGSGADTIFGDDAAGGNDRNVINGKGGSDWIYCYSGQDVINGGGGNDTVTVFAAAALQVVDGGGGTDQLTLLAYSNTSAGLTLALGASASLSVNGLASASYLNFESLNVTGGTGGNSLTGGDLNDTLTNSLNNVSSFKAGMLDGGGGDDALAVFGFVDTAKAVETVTGGAGTDTLTWTNGAGNGHALVVNGSASTGTIGSDGQVFVSFSQVEVFRFQTYADYSGTLHYTGITGNDSVDAYATSSVVNTGDGNDFVIIEAGASTVSGGAGDDVLSLGFSNGAAFAFSGDGGNDRLYGGSGTGSLAGAGGADSLYGGSGRATLDGGDGADYLSATGGLVDSLAGGSGNDILIGGLGKDTLNGGSGLDQMTGGEGADHFYFSAASDTTKSLSTCDEIRDFSQGLKDKIDLHSLAGSVTGGAGFLFIAAKDFSGTAGELRYVQFDESGTSQDHTEVLGDLNGDGTVDMMIDVTGLIAFKAGDFILV